MSTLQRRYPRVFIKKPGEVVLTPEDGSKRTLATIRSITCEGAGLELQDPSILNGCDGDQLSVRFPIGSQSIELPANIAWRTRARNSERPMDVGIRLDLETAASESRLLYAPWIVTLIARNRNYAMQVGGELVRLGAVSLRTLQLALDCQRVAGGHLEEILLEMKAVNVTTLLNARRRVVHTHEYNIPQGLMDWQHNVIGSAEESTVLVS